MRPDQREALSALSERLTDCVLNEADPDNWPGAGLRSKDWSREERGDRYWSKKNAAATLSVLQRVHGVLEYRTAAGEDADELDIDKSIAAAEKMAQKLIDKMQQRGPAH